MRDQYRLVGLANSKLLAGLSELVQQSNGLTAQVLAHLVELEGRMLHLELGFSSLFAYCVEALGMSEGAAGRRVAAARVCRRFPEAFERVARGELHLGALCALAPHLNSENATKLFEACQGKTRRQIEEQLAARFPRPDVREQIRRLPVRAAVSIALVEQPLLSARVSDEPLVAAAPMAPMAGMVPMAPMAPEMPVMVAPRPVGSTGDDARRRARELEPLSADRFGVHFTADAELRELIERARALASHRLPNGDLASLMKLMAASFVQQEEKRRFGVGARLKNAKSETGKETTKVARIAERRLSRGEGSVPPEMSEATKREAGLVGRGGPPGGASVSPEMSEATKREAGSVGRGGPPGGASVPSEMSEVTKREAGSVGRGVSTGEGSVSPEIAEAMKDEAVGRGAPPGGALSASEAEPTKREERAVAVEKRGRYLAVAVRREIHDRDRGRCAFVSTDGRRCAARALLEFDHVEPHARFGGADATNIRLLCRAHNLLHARNCFGAMHLAAKIAARKRSHAGGSAKEVPL